MMYEDLVLKLRAWENAGESNSRVFGQAADAIEEEDMAFRHLERDYKELCAHLPKWIPVTERLPEDGELVLGYTPCDGYMFVGKCYTYKFRNETEIRWEIITAMRSTRTMRKKVTHWMPLPTAPESHKEK